MPIRIRLHFLNEPGDLPERRVVRPVGVAAAELVVEDEFEVASGHLAEAIEVAAAYTRAAVQAKQGAASHGAEDAVRDLVPAFYFDAALHVESGAALRRSSPVVVAIGDGSSFPFWPVGCGCRHSRRGAHTRPLDL